VADVVSVDSTPPSSILLPQSRGHQSRKLRQTDQGQRRPAHGSRSQRL